MKVKIGLFSFQFDPASVDWKNQSSQACEFGFWNAGKRRVFVKRFLQRPSGWNLLRDSILYPVPNTPQVHDLSRNESHFYIFSKALEGDTLLSFLRKQPFDRLFGSKGLTPGDRFQIAFSVLRVLQAINQRGYWYPDLDFKNLFISPYRKNYRVHLIDMDSCVLHGESFDPGNVSQTYWEGLVKTSHKFNKKFLGKNSAGILQIIPEGRLLNQSMAVLFAHGIQRLGFVPKELPLLEPLINSKNPYSSIVSSIHNKLIAGEDAWDEVENFLSCFFKISRTRFLEFSREYVSSARVNLVGMLNSNARKKKAI